jgi:hypothetical protein
MSTPVAILKKSNFGPATLIGTLVYLVGIPVEHYRAFL